MGAKVTIEYIKTGQRMEVTPTHWENIQKLSPGKFKAVESNDWKSELIALKGIGEKTAEDIIQVFPTRVDLLYFLEGEGELMFSENVNEILKSL